MHNIVERHPRQLGATLNYFILVLLLCSLASSMFSPIVSGNSSEVHVFITPPAYVAKELGEVFDLTVNISNVNNLCSFGFILNFNTSQLDVVDVSIGTFFPEPPGSHFEFEKNESLGFISVNASLNEFETPRSGNGTLAHVNFRVSSDPESCVCSILYLDQIVLIDSTSNTISYDSVSAVYMWKSLQPDPPVIRRLDLLTPRDGKGSGRPGGVFYAGEVVELISNLTYNNEPVQQKLVSIEVRDSHDEIVLMRVAMTDENGTCKILFRLPKDIVSYEQWSAIAVAEVREVVVWDILKFDVFPSAPTMPVGGSSTQIKWYGEERLIAFYGSLLAIYTLTTHLVHRHAQKTRQS